LPTDVVEFSVKTILLKMRWIDLSSSAFYSLPSMLSLLTFTSFEPALLPSSSSLGSHVGGRFLAFYPNRFDLWKDLGGWSSSST
jgi:hypothetical protein